MKHFLGFITIFFSMNMASADPLPQELPSFWEGPIKYYVSEPTREVFVELPALARLTILDLGPDSDSEKYYVTLKASYNSRLNRPEISKIRSLFPGFKLIEDQGFIRLNSFSVQFGPELTMDLESSPSGEVDVFGHAILSLHQGQALRDKLRQGLQPIIRLNVKYAHPQLLVKEQISVDSSGICTLLPQQGTLASMLSVLLKPVARLTSRLVSPTLSRLTLEKILIDCLELPTPSLPSSLDALLSQITLKSLRPLIPEVLYEAQTVQRTQIRDMKVEFIWEAN